MSIKYNNTTWNIIEKYFYDNPQVLVKHHIASYNDFFRTGVKSIFKERNPIILQKEQHEKTNEFKAGKTLVEIATPVNFWDTKELDKFKQELYNLVDLGVVGEEAQTSSDPLGLGIN